VTFPFTVIARNGEKNLKWVPEPGGRFFPAESVQVPISSTEASGKILSSFEIPSLCEQRESPAIIRFILVVLVYIWKSHSVVAVVKRNAVTIHKVYSP
jgi:hypothetical protein